MLGFLENPERNLHGQPQFLVQRRAGTSPHGRCGVHLAPCCTNMDEKTAGRRHVWCRFPRITAPLHLTERRLGTKSPAGARSSCKNTSDSMRAERERTR